MSKNIVICAAQAEEEEEAADVQEVEDAGAEGDDQEGEADVSLLWNSCKYCLAVLGYNRYHEV